MENDRGNVDLAAGGAEPLREDDPAAIGGIPLLGRLGAGGMGRVYLGLAEEGFAAVKQVLPQLAEDADFLRRFGHELDNLGRLPERVSAPLLASDRAAVPPWLATAYVPGLDVDAAVSAVGPLPADALWRLLGEVAERLVTVHRLGLCHRDLKPSNVMLTSGGGLVLIDFGIARAVDQSRVTRTGMAVGTPGYMAPEQATSGEQPAAPADVFALGSLLYYAATGRPPFGTGHGPGVLYRVVHEECDLAPVREVDAELAEVIAACHAKSPADRPTALDLRERVRRREPSAGAAWPETLEARLAGRAAFAATAGGLDRAAIALTAPDKAPEPGPEPGPEYEPTAADPAKAGGEAAKQEPKKRGRRWVILPILVPVVGGVTVLSLTLLPDRSPVHAAGGPQSQVSSSAGAGSGSTRPSASAGGSGTPATSASGPRSTAPTAPGTKSGGRPSTRTGGTAGSSGSSSGSGGGASSSGGASGGASGGGASASGGASGTSGTSGGSSGKSGGTTPSAPTGTHQLKSGAGGQCLFDSDPPMTKACADDGNYDWKFVSQGNGKFTVLNSLGNCMAARSGFTYVAMVGCQPGTGYDITWELGPSPSGSGMTLKNTGLGTCVDNVQPGSGGVTVAACNASRSGQIWHLA